MPETTDARRDTTARPQPPMVNDAALDFLFVSESPVWPARQGFAVHGPAMARALAQRGYRVAIACMPPPQSAASASDGVSSGISTCANIGLGARIVGDIDPPMPDGLSAMMLVWPTAQRADVDTVAAAWSASGRGLAAGLGPLAGRLRHRLAGHQGIEAQRVAGVVSLVRRYRPRVVLALAQHGSMLLQPVKRIAPRTTCLWYAADDPLRFQLSCLRRDGLFNPLAWRRRGRMLAAFALMQRLYTAELDGAIGVSETDAAWLRATAGLPRACCIPNGVDLEAYRPQAAHGDLCQGARTPASVARMAPGRGDGGAASRSLVFWGRMDFEPNVDAVCWFASVVWPRLRERHGEAVWWIVGKAPTPRVRSLGKVPGIEVVGEVPDVRPWARRAAVTVLPMRLGTGIKNKLLEAAAMGRPIVASRRAARDLTLPTRDGAAGRYGAEPFRLADDAWDWVAAVEGLWSAPNAAAGLGQAARSWVEAHYSWPRAAARLEAWLQARPVTQRQAHLKARPGGADESFVLASPTVTPRCRRAA